MYTYTHVILHITHSNVFTIKCVRTRSWGALWTRVGPGPPQALHKCVSNKAMPTWLRISSLLLIQDEAPALAVCHPPITTGVAGGRSGDPLLGSLPLGLCSHHCPPSRGLPEHLQALGSYSLFETRFQCYSLRDASLVPSARCSLSPSLLRYLVLAREYSRQHYT